VHGRYIASEYGESLALSKMSAEQGGKYAEQQELALDAD
jgi:hypothetical protein